MKKFIRFITRVDIFNRMIVFVSMALFIVLPSWLLFLMDEERYSLEIIVPCTLLLGILLGNGLLVCYRPIRTSWLYFLICIVSIPILYYALDLTMLDLDMNLTAIFWLSLIYSILGLLINLFLMLYTARKKSKSMLNEQTNNDHAFDFLGGKRRNEAIADKLNEIENSRFLGKLTSEFNKIKFSRFTRIASFIFAFITSFIYLIISVKNQALPSNLLAVCTLLFVLIIPICLIASIFYPLDFKYIYYFNSMFILLMAIIISRTYTMPPLMLILALILVGLSFIVTLIVEGRTWTGDKPD